MNDEIKEREERIKEGGGRGELMKGDQEDGCCGEGKRHIDTI